MNTTTILRYGTPVRLESVDLYGFCGRDNHPEPDDVGFLGVVVGNFVQEFNTHGDVSPGRENVLGGTEFKCFDNEYVAVCYKVRASDGRVLELMNHEIEVLA